MLVDVPVSRSKVLVVGGGAVAERKVRKLLLECPNVMVASLEFTKGLKALGTRGKVRLMNVDAGAGDGSLERVMASFDMVVVATSDPKVNGRVAARARRAGRWVNAADNPGACDFYFPAGAVMGGVRIAVSTGGRSPAMAKLLCRRLSMQISKTDRLQARLQGDVRELATRVLPNSASRKRALYSVLSDDDVHGLLEKGRFGEAERMAKQLIVQESKKLGRR